jgi:hypothetical protein
MSFRWKKSAKSHNLLNLRFRQNNNSYAKERLTARASGRDIARGVY